LKTDASVEENHIQSLKNKISDYEKEQQGLESLKMNNAALMEVSNELEKQVIDFERINEKLEAKVEKVKAEKRELQLTIDKEKEETRRAKISVNEQKSSNILIESKVKAFQERVDMNEKENLEEKNAHEKHINEYKTLCQKLSSTLDEMTKDNASKEQFGLVNERAKNNIELESKQLKEELTSKISQLNSHKESNFKLTQGIEEAIQKISDKNELIENMKNTVEAEKRIIEEKITRHEATLAQQTKLIDFLQSKVAGLEGRKKTFADKIFGGNKENRPGSSNSVTGVPVAYADLEVILEKEKLKNKKLTSQLSRARTEVVALKTITTSVIPLALPVNKIGQTSHNIPHRLGHTKVKKTTKCPVCLESISLMTVSSQCRDCSVTVHTSCSSSLPPTCGLSSQLLAALPTTEPHITERPLPPPPTKSRVTEGSVKTLVGGQWTECHLVLGSTNMLDLYRDKEGSIRLDQVGLTNSNCRVSVQSSVTHNEVLMMSTTDRPYTFKLTAHSSGKPEKVIYLMCNNFSTKVEWVNKLEEVIKSCPANLVLPEEIGNIVSRRLLCSLPPTEEILSVCQVDDLILLGSSQGLGVLTAELGLVNCGGVSCPVTRVQHVKSLNMLVLISGGDLSTVTCRGLTLSSPTVKPEKVQDISNCHTFSAAETEIGKVFLCAANEHLVVILEWSPRRGEFVLRNKFSTDQYTSCIHFTHHSILVGTTKFYEIDLKNFSAEEFLDLSNPGIKEIVSSSDFSGSLPKSIIRLSMSDQEPEYLLAFTRHILFVDTWGQQTRPTIVLERLPVEHLVVGEVLTTSFCDQIEFRSLKTRDVIGRLVYSSPHLLDVTKEGEIMVSHQDTATNNLVTLSLCME